MNMNIVFSALQIEIGRKTLPHRHSSPAQPFFYVHRKTFDLSSRKFFLSRESSSSKGSRPPQKKTLSTK